MDKITRKSFTKSFDGANSSYSSYLLANTTIDKVLDVLNNKNILEYDRLKEDFCDAREENGNVSFIIFGEFPTLIYDLTYELHTTGFADTDWDVTYTIVSKDGKDYEGYSAEWLDGCPCAREDDCYDAFVIITDEETGAVFNTGAGAVGEDILKYYADMVRKH